MSLTDSQKVLRNDVGKAIAGAVADVAAAIRTGGFSNGLLAALLTHENYKAVMKAWFESKGCAAMSDFTELCEEWYKLTRTGWSGGVRFQIPASGATANSDGARTGDAVGMSCTPSTPTTAGQDDFADVPLFFPIDVNTTLDSNGDPHITAIDGVCGSFARTDTSKIVAVMQMTGWERFVVDGTAGVYGWDYTDEAEKDGYHPLPEAVSLYSNTVRNFVVHGKYNFGDNWQCCSGQKMRVWDVSHDAQLSGVRTAWGTRYCGGTSADDAFMKLMLYIKYARLDTDRILAGCCDYNYTYQLAAGETGVERILLTTSQAANLVVGSTICVGTASSRSSTKSQNTGLLDRVKITSIETVNVGGSTYAAVNVDNGGTTFNTSTSYYAYTYQWHTGSTDNVLGNDGGIDPSSAMYPVKIQGIEYMLGAYEVVGDTILKHSTVSSTAVMLPYICRDATKLATGTTSDYTASTFGVPKPASSGWQYPKQMRQGSSLPELIFPADIGGSTSGGPRDGFYLEAQSASGDREWLRFGHLDNGVGYAGLSCGGGNSALSGAYWNIGGRLSVTGNRGEYQAAA